jgi:alkylation response protein AidB-like acyl-CoA dehydrogenase
VTQGDHYVLSGAKNWITNSPIADICLVRALNTVSFLLKPSLSFDLEVWAKTDTDEKASRHRRLSNKCCFAHVAM